MEQIFQLGTFLISIVTFLIMFLIIRRYAFKPLASMLEQRRVHIVTQINEAEESRTRAEELLNEQKKLLDEARHEAKNLLESARMRADEQARETVQEAQAEATRLLDEGRQLIERERTEALTAVLGKVTALTVELTTKLLHNHVTPEVHLEMMAEAEKRLGELA